MVWPPRDLQNLERRLDDLAKLTGGLNNYTDEEARGWLARLLVVRACGYLEQVVHEVTRAYVSEKSGGLVRTFAHSWLERSRNPSIPNLLDHVGRFDGSLREELEQLMDADDQRLRRELSFLVDRRHKIAHGLNESITPGKALALTAIAKEMADWFVRRLNPHPHT